MLAQTEMIDSPAPNGSVAVRQSVDAWRRLIIIFVGVVVLTVPAAYFNGLVLLRWGDDAILTHHTAALTRVPTHFGEWVLVEEGEPISDYLIEQLELRGTLHRVYEHQQTGQRVALLLLVGPPGSKGSSV